MTVSISGGTATATRRATPPPATGTDYWVATYNGDSNNTSVTSGTAAEPVNVDTDHHQPDAGHRLRRRVDRDTATVTGLVSPSSGDTVTFNLYNNSTASGTPLFTVTVTVSISGGTATATSPGYTTTGAGTDYWVATFNGDSNNAAVTSGAAASGERRHRSPPASSRPAPTSASRSATRPRSPAWSARAAATR